MLRLSQLWLLARKAPLRPWLLFLLLSGLGLTSVAATPASASASASASAPATPPPLTVADADAIPLWPAVTLRRDASHALTLQQVLAEPARWTKPTGTPGNLGHMADTVWLQVPLHVAGAQAQQRVLEINYPTLNRIDVYLVRQGRLVQHDTLGSQLRVADRAIGSRAMAVPLRLEPGPQQLLVKVRTQSSMVLPLTLHTPRSFLAHESRAQLGLGLLFGAALCMLVYSMAHWVSLRDPLFLQYAGLLAGSLLFMLGYFGIGQQVLWPDAPEFAMRVAPMGILIAAVSGAAFHRRSLRVHEISPRMDRTMQWLGLAAACTLVAGVLGLPYTLLQRIAAGLGLVITLLTLPVVFVRARRGERVAWYMLVGLAAYMVGATVLTSLLIGWVQPSAITQHVFPVMTMLEMAAWMGVLGLNVQAIHRNADRTRVESETLRKLAHTDALTGLPNRRGLQERLALALQSCNPQQLLAVYLLDLDGFKLVNDRFGHDVGDALLVAVGQRVQAQLRGSDVVARLGGDEFVVLASGLADEAAARALGSKMLDAFDTPFSVLGQTCAVGLTIGYALAPLDSQHGDDLLRRADAAMYAGKQAGRQRVTRGGRASVSVF